MCGPAGGKLSISLVSTKLARGTALRFSGATFYLDKGVKHTRKERIRRHGKPGIQTVTVTTYTANARATRLPASKGLPLKGLKSGLHTLTVKISYKETKTIRTKRRGKMVKNTKVVIVSRTLRAKFTVC